jgi:hypothetical protein
MTLRTTLAFAAALAAACFATAQEATRGGNIVPPTRRADMLRKADEVTRRSVGDYAERAAAIQDPFHAPAPAAAAATDPLAGLSDAQILERAAGTLAFNGILARRDRRWIQLGSELVSQGATIEASLSGRRISLRVVEIRARSVVLGYNAETFEITIR